MFKLNGYKRRLIPKEAVKLKPEPEPEPEPKKKYSIIPLNIFQNWSTINLPIKMKENVELLKKQNPEFNHYLYDENACREFIKYNFHEDVLYSFDKLKPGSYKSDLWRYCVLYIHGGIYLDINYSCVNNFKLLHLTDKEYYVNDTFYKNVWRGVYNGLIVSLPYNDKLLKTIYYIVECVKNIFYIKYYNIDTIDSTILTGSIAFSKQFHYTEIQQFTLNFSECSNYIMFNDKNSLYKENCNEINIDIEYYADLYKKYNVYNFLYLTPTHTINLSRELIKIVNNKNVTFFTSNPCIIKHPTQPNNYIINIRWINYKLDNITGKATESQPLTISLNSYFIMDSMFNKISEEEFLTPIDDYTQPYKYYGIEDIRLFNYSNKMYYIGSLFNQETNNISITSDICDFTNSYEFNKKIITPSFNKQTEKNWCFVNYHEKLCVIYKWNPLIICEINDNELNIIERKYIKFDFFKKVKGSTSGVLFNNEIWFVLHVSQSNNYQHFFAVFDTDMNLLRYTEPFKLDNCRVEFCIGLIIEKERTILSFTSSDTNTFIGIYDNDYINSIKWY
jgi:hypothetical protein